ncbi:aminotransferase-like domain-containing protein [Tessaracoccus sp. Y36]
MHIDAFRELLLDRSPGAAPLPVQVAAGIRDFVALGSLLPGEAVPSTRAAAVALGVSRGTVAAAYDQLVAEEYLVARDRSGTVVNPDLRSVSAPTVSKWMGSSPRHAGKRPETNRDPIQLLTGSDGGAWPDDAAWRSAWRRAVTDEPVPALAEAVAEHLRHMRGVVVEADGITVTSGARSGLSLLLAVAARRAGRRPRVAVESPGFPGLRRLLEHSAVDTAALPVGAAGPHLEALSRAHRRSPIDLAIVTPNHQYPDGGALSARHRQAMIAWARDEGVVLVEDDFDSERRHLGPPLPTLWSLDPTVVAHLGTFAAVIGRGVGTGYLVAPASWHAEIVGAADATGAAPPLLLQRAVASYLADGGLRRRLARARRRASSTNRELTFR